MQPQLGDVHRLVQDRKSKLLTLIVIAIILVTAFEVLRSYFPFLPVYLLLASLPVAFFGPYFYLLYKYFAGKRGYQNRYAYQSMEYARNQSIIRLLFVFIIGLLVFSLIDFALKATGTDNVTLSLGLTLFVVIGGVQLIDYYAGKDMEEYVDYKERSHKDYVNSLGTAEGLCMSCRRRVEKDTNVCPHCGYDMKKKEKNDYGYISRK